MRFWDREREVRYLKAHMLSVPNSILFLYGPKSSGKTALLTKVAGELKGQASFFWYDLRETAIFSAEDAIRTLFSRGKLSRSFTRGISISFAVININLEEIEKMIRGENDPFSRFRNEVAKRAKRRRVVVVFDEIQRFKHIYDKGGRELLEGLFNLFVALTKVEHLAHVVVATSDTFFIEEVYTNSSLEGCARFFLLDYFDKQTTIRVLMEEGASEEEAQYVWEQIGGRPWELMEIAEAIKMGRLKEAVEELHRTALGRLKEVLSRLDEEDSLKQALNVLWKAMNTADIMDFERQEKKLLRKLVNAEMLFYDPLSGKVRPHTRLYEHAIREILG